MRGFTEGDRIRAGDRIVAIDGALITTRDGGNRLVDLRVGQGLNLQVRRDGRVVDLNVVAGSACALQRARRYGEVQVERLSVPGPDFDFGDPAPPAPRAPTALPPLPPLRPDDSGYLGFGIRCSDCTISQGGFSFSSPPTVMNVNEESPAATAGLRTGDVILEIDGLDITAAGTDRFNAIEPGDTVVVTYRRDGDQGRATVVAGERPDRVRFAPMAPAPAPAPRPMSSALQFEGAVNGATIEVRGAPITVTRDQETGELIIRTRGNVIRIRPEG